MTDQAIHSLFPQGVIEQAQQVAAGPGIPAAPSCEELTALVSRFQSEAKCRAYLQRLRWPDGVRCPRCDAGKGISRIETRDQFECDGCGYQFSIRAGTLLHDSPLPLWKWFLAVSILDEAEPGISATGLGRALGVSYKTAWYLRHRIRVAMREQGEAAALPLLRPYPS